jgi:hypothetical protein
MAYSSQSLEATVPITDSSMGFETSLASNYLVIGAPGANTGYGLAYIFSRSGTTWSQAAVLDPGTGFGAAPYYFGSTLDNTNTNVVVGAPFANAGFGKVLVYNTAGSLTQTITPTANQRNAFGYCVKLSGANTLFVGTTGNNNQQAVLQYFSANGTTGWTFVRAFSSNDIAPVDKYQFGKSIAVNTGRDEIFIGAPYYGRRGGVYYYRYDTTLGWILGQLITLNGAYLDTAGDQFGSDIDVKGDYLLIGARNKLTIDGFSNAQNTGAAFIYKRAGLYWTLQSIISSSDSNPGNYFGNAVALSASGSTGLTLALIGAEAYGSDSGKVYAYNLSVPYNPQPAFTIDSPKAIKTAFGSSLNVLETLNSGTALAGAPGNAVNDAGSGDRYGQAFVLNQIGTIAFTPTPTPSPPPPSVTPTPTPAATPRFLASNLYGLGPDLDPISIGDGALANTGIPDSVNYPKIPALGGPGRNFSILREIGLKAPLRQQGYQVSTLAALYIQWCLTRNMNSGTPHAFSEFCDGRGISLAMNVVATAIPEQDSKYNKCDNGKITVTVTDNPTRTPANKYDIYINGVLVAHNAYYGEAGDNKQGSGVDCGGAGKGFNTGNYPVRVVDLDTGYERNFSVFVAQTPAPTNTYSFNYRTDVPTQILNPP